MDERLKLIIDICKIILNSTSKSNSRTGCERSGAAVGFALPLVEKSVALMFLLPHQEPLVPRPFHPSIKCQIRVFWKSICHACCRLLFHCVFCFSTGLQYRFHPLPSFLKTLPEYPFKITPSAMPVPPPM